MSAQSNPVIFVALGQGANIWSQLSQAISSYASSVAYIQLPSADTIDTFQDEDFDAWAKGEVARVWKEFLQLGQLKAQREQYSADIVRVNYILGTDDGSLILPVVRHYMEKYLIALYPAGFLTDIYCLLDDDKLLENEDSRRRVMSMLKTVNTDGLRIYLLSNLTSQNLLISNEAIANTIAMLTLFKDCTPDTYVTGADASRYNELYFSDNCYSKEGQFFTASTLNVTVPIHALKALLLAELLTFGQDPNCTTSPLATPLEGGVFSTTDITIRQVKPMDYLLGLAIPEVADLNHLSNGDILSKLFGTRLDQIIEEGNQAELAQDTLPSLITEGSNLYELLRLTSKEGAYEGHINQAIAQAAQNLESFKAQISTWQSATPNLTKGSPLAEKRRLSPFMSQELMPFVIAHGYMQKKAELNLIERKISLLEGRRDTISAAHSKLQTYQQAVQKAVDTQRQTAQILDTAFAPFAPNATDYFRKLFLEYASQNAQELTQLSTKMTGALLSGNLHGHIKTLENYITQQILKAPQFSKPIMDTLYELVATNINSHQDKLTEALGEWVFNHRQWDIRLKTGYTNLYTEINIYMPAQGAANVKRRYEERGFGRMNLFADENADQVSVLYHAGTFNLEDLYYESLYSQAGE